MRVSFFVCWSIVTMAIKKARSKSRRAFKTKTNRRSVPLLAETAAVRKARPQVKAKRAATTASAGFNPAFAMFGFMGRETAAYAELPARLVQCRSPMDVWCEQARFAQRILSLSSSRPRKNSR